MFNESELESEFRRCNLLLSDETFVDYNEIYPFRIGGTECMVMAAEVLYSRNNTESKRQFVAKMVLPPLGVPPDLRVKTMLKRMNSLVNAGIRVPELYSAIEGVIYQQYIPYSVSDVLNRKTLDDRKTGLMLQLAEIAAKLDRSGAYPNNFIADLRADEKYLYYVDWGVDLGEFNHFCSSRAWETLRNFCREMDLDYSLERKLEEIYKKIIAGQ